MKFSFGSNHLWFIGDPHFGRNFNTGMPLHRRGHREAMQRQQFLDELNYQEANTIVMVGDLFDKPIVPLPVLAQVIKDVRDVAVERDDVEFIFLAGNHDLSRQVDQWGAWEIFCVSMYNLHNVHIVDEPQAINGIMYYPWQWTVSSHEQVENYGSRQCVAAVGHWDLQDFGGDTSHMAPVAALKAFNPDVTIISGHYHKEGVYTVDGVDVHCTGSLQPYAHGEGDMYVTLNVAEALAADPADLYNKCVRVVLLPGEILPEIDCLQLTSMRVLGDETVTEIDLDAIGAQAFNLASTLEEEFAEKDVPPPVQGFIKENLSAAD